MKKGFYKKGLLTVILSASIILGVTTVGTLAASGDENFYSAEDDSALEWSEIPTVDAAGGAETANATQPDTEIADTKESGEGVNFFEKLYLTLSDYVSEIFCLLAFVGSFLIALLYKKGLVPLVKGALGAIGGTVNKIKDVTESHAESQMGITAGLTEALDRAYTLIEGQGALLVDVQKRLDELSGDKNEKEKIKIVLESEVELLYDIFMSSALPEYQKDAVAKRLKAIRAVIKEDEAEG